MNARACVRIAAVVAPLLAAGAIATISCSDQPTPKCTTARGNFSAVYTLVSGSGPCSMLAGDVLGVQAYNPAKSDMTPNFDQATVAIQPTSITNLLGGPADPNASDLPYGLGAFSTSEPGSDGFCVAPTLSVARLRQPEVVAMPNACPPVAGSPAVDVQYAFTNVRVYSTAAALGTELSADLTYTTTDPTGATCVAKYHVRGVYPSVSCGAPGPTPPGDDGGGMEAGAMSDDGGGMEAASTSDTGAAGGDAGTGDDGGGDAMPAPACDAGMMMAAPPAAPMVPSNDLCSPYANPDAGMATGSGINPDFAIVCDPNLLLCVPAKEPPSLK